MRMQDVKAVIMYYRDIPEMKKLLIQERRELEDEYCGLKGVSMDEAPRGGSTGKPVEGQMIAMEESGAAARLRDIGKLTGELEADRQRVQCAIDALNGRYKRVLKMRYLGGYSWAKISVQIGASDSTVRRWHDKALLCLGKAMEESGEVNGILARSFRAYT